MKNDYRIEGDTVVIVLKARDGSTKAEAYIDTSDLHWADSISGTWACSDAYVAARVVLEGKATTAYLHRVITAAPKGMRVDHINHNGYDNRRCNLRVVTNSENLQNLLGPKEGSTTGVLNVHASGRPNKPFRATCVVNGAVHRGPRRSSLEEAQEDAVEMRQRLHTPIKSLREAQ